MDFKTDAKLANVFSSQQFSTDHQVRLANINLSQLLVEVVI